MVGTDGDVGERRRGILIRAGGLPIDFRIPGLHLDRAFVHPRLIEADLVVVASGGSGVDGDGLRRRRRLRQSRLSRASRRLREFLSYLPAFLFLDASRQRLQLARGKLPTTVDGWTPTAATIAST